MNAWYLRLTTGLLFVAIAMTTIPVISEPWSPSRDADPATAVRMVDRTRLGARVETREFEEGRYAGKNSDFIHLAKINYRDSFLSSGPDPEVAVQHGRDLTSLSSGQDTNSSASFRAEVGVLIAFKEGITNDSLGGLSSWKANDSSACGWEGVTCASQSRRIVALNLSNLLLKGTINPLLGSLQFLQQLDLSYNSLSGEIPISLLNCSSLSHIALGSNNISGRVPFQLGLLLQLVSLDLSNNAFLAGTFPSSLGNCSLLQSLSLHSTSIGGEIPSSIGQLANLEYLDLSATSISGTIPASLGNCSSLSLLILGNQDVKKALLSGELPTELGSLTRMTKFNIAGTNIVGNFPGWIANFTGLKYLLITYNSFSGEIPDFLGQLPLYELVLGTNNFTGAIPAIISNCSELLTLELEANSFTGAIPPELGSLKKLQALSLVINLLSGTIPTSLANCSAMMFLSLGLNPSMDAQPFPSWIGSLLEIENLWLYEMNLQGVIPADIGKLSQLQALGLYDNNLSGQIPPALGNCTSLVDLEINDNALSGEIPPGIWLLNGMQYLILGNNNLTGTLPASIGNFSQLFVFEGYRNQFSGVLPTEIGSLESLFELALNDNNFEGHVPQSVGNLSALNQLVLSNNYLVGEIPASVGNLSELTIFRLDQNRLQGSIPVGLMQCTQLTDLELHENSLDGSIPADIGMLQSLQYLSLFNNNLSGILPDSLGGSLLVVDISFNAIHGVLPTGIFAGISSGLIAWRVGHNLLSGSLPMELVQLEVVNHLDFSANNFSGSIPRGLGECNALSYLDLSVNNLSGPIPETLVQLRNLVYFNVSDNQLEGTIPTGGIFATGNLTAASFFGNDGLCGSILGNACPILAPSGSPPKSTCRGFSCASIRIAVACIVAGLLFAILLLGFLLWFYKRKTGGIWGKAGGEEDNMVFFEKGSKFSKEDLMTIMASPENMIAVGAKSTVYKGTLTDDRVVAIKTSSILADGDDGHYKQAEADLLREARTLSKLKHRNILKVLACFRTRDVVALISEYMPMGSLTDQLYPSSEECNLNWDARLNIALGVAQALTYLHSHFHEPVIHRDLKPNNVFLDADLQPRLGDFGISRFANPDRDGEKTASTFCGTIGYIPPEYGATTRVSTRGDVYSYGVILLELLTRKHPITLEESASGDCGHIVDWVSQSFEQNPLTVLDKSLINESVNEEGKREQMKLLIRVGLLCTRREPENRPQINDVLGMIHQIIQRELTLVGQPSLDTLAEQRTIQNSTGDPSSTDILSF